MRVVVRAIGPALAAVAALACAAPAAPPGTPVSVPVVVTVAAPLDDAARAVVVRVNVDTCNGSGHGSGFFARDGEVITNRHVVDDAVAVRVVTAEGRPIDVMRVEVAPGSDLARLQVTDATRTRPARLAAADPRSGSGVRVVGYPRDLPLTATTGRVVDVTDRFDGAAYTQRVSAVVEPGNSGGPLLADDGSVVGVVYAVELGSGRGLVIPVSELRTALDRPWQGHIPPAC